MDLIQGLADLPYIGPLLPWLMIALTVAGAAAQFVAPYVKPPASPYGWAALWYGLLNKIAGNWGRARNAEAPTGRSPLSGISPPGSLLSVALMAFLIVGCQSQSQTRQVQAIVAGVDVALVDQRDEIIAQVPEADRLAATLALDGAHAAAGAVAAIDPASTPEAQVLAAVGGFLASTGPLLANLPLKPYLRTLITVAVTTLRVVLGLPPATAPPVATSGAKP